MIGLMGDRYEFWPELERRTFTLIDSLSARIDGKNLDLLRDFVENREYGVALEWLGSLVSERAIPLLPEQGREMKELAALMGLKLDESRGSHS
jgi:hypothetical protein